MKYQNIAAIWKKQDKNGKTYLSFKAERDIKSGESFNLFANDKDGVAARPDFRAYKKIDDNEDERYSDLTNASSEKDISDDIPF